MNKLLGSRIKALRSANNLTQEEVADQIGISRQKYARIESGVNSITLDILSTTIYLWLISLTASKELSILLLKLYNDGAIGISSSLLGLCVR